MKFFGFDIGPWQVFGFVGTFIFGTRFFVQWIASERARKSVIPVAFWWLSIFGSLILLLYFIHRRDLVGILGYLPNTIPYTRNLILVYRHRNAQNAMEQA